MTAIDRLAQQIDNLMYELHRLKAENKRLKKELALLATTKEKVAHLEKEKHEQTQKIIKLTQRLEKLVKV